MQAKLDISPIGKKNSQETLPLSGGTGGTRNPIFRYPQYRCPWRNGLKLNKTFLHFFAEFLPYMYVYCTYSVLMIFQSSAVPSALSTLKKKIIKYGKNWQKKNFVHHDFNPFLHGTTGTGNLGFGYPFSPQIKHQFVPFFHLKNQFLNLLQVCLDFVFILEQ